MQPETFGGATEAAADGHADGVVEPQDRHGARCPHEPPTASVLPSADVVGLTHVAGETHGGPTDAHA